MIIPSERIVIGLFLSIFAGLSTALGAIVVFLMKKPDNKMISASMGFSAGVMIGVSIFELFPEAASELGTLIAGISFLLGMVAVAALDFLIPHHYMHEHTSSDRSSSIIGNPNTTRLLRTGKLIAIGIAIHNFPEGIITMSGSLYSIELGLLIAIAIALHNIPEGLSVAIPIYCASDDKKKAFKLSFFSGLAEPIGAIIGLLILFSLGVIITEILILSLAFVAGIMTFISLDELLPSAHETCNNNGDNAHIVTGGILAGMAIMLITIGILG
ncbi:MAG: zinc transporter ZupT [Candidatus Hodarchaeota archaeon]